MVIYDLIMDLHTNQISDSLSSIHTTISYNNDTKLATLSIEGRDYHYKKATVFLTCEVNLSQLKVKEYHVGFNRILHELTTKNSGVDCIDIRWHINTEFVRVSGNWLEKNIETKKQTNITPVAVAMMNNGKYHHNTKPAVVDSKDNKVSVIEFYKNGKQCIPKEHPYPSSIVLSTRESSIRERIDDSLRSLYCRVPKTRWTWLNNYRKTTEYMVAEQWLWDDVQIPEDIFPLVEYPIDDIGMFTIMMSI